MIPTELKYRVDIRLCGAHPYLFEQLDLVYVDRLSDVEYYIDKYCSEKDKSVCVNITIELTDKSLWQKHLEKRLKEWRENYEKQEES